MATLCHFPRFSSIFFLDHHTLLEPKLGLGCYTLQHPPPHKHFTLRASSIKKSRKKVKSNVELCNDIREFIAVVGLPQDHVPTMKELSEHGRNDLAHIVRRRGYKVIRELLTNSTETDVDEFNVKESIAEHKVAISDREDIVTEGQDVEVNSVVGEFPSSTEVNITENSAGSLIMDQHLNSDDSTHIPLESNDGLSLEGNASHKFQDEANNFAGEVVLSTEVSIVENYSSSSNSDPALSSEDHSCVPIGSSTKLSLEGKVANFVQHGDLDAVEDSVYGMSSENATEETKGYIELENAEEIECSTPTSKQPENVLNGGSAAATSNGRGLNSMQVVPSAKVNHPLRNTNLSAESHGPSTQDNEDLEAETRKRENQAEITKLKLMLHQKELELSRLKEQIEKEKVALSVLQIKAESEISKAQRMISEKDAELHTTEETLSGLVEVEIKYCGDGETVEVAGSFNGWHHWIKMDLQPPSGVPESIGTRKNRLWSTVLWLYPGAYEIKFIVDGKWKVDPQRESVTRRGISNNVLCVER